MAARPATRCSTLALRDYLLRGRLSGRGCLQNSAQHQGKTWLLTSTPRCSSRVLHTSPHSTTTTTTSSSSSNTSTALPVALRKQLKEEARARKALLASEKPGRERKTLDRLRDWELTVGIEIHAQLNTPRKLFSPAASTINDEPNTHVAMFDLSLPGTLPLFQKESLIPALRAALALNCDVQRTSRWDRKHYFHWDQPAGYQITQYYQPFARDGHITLHAHDGIAAEDGESITVGIKQVQMEQDTAKTVSEGDVHLLDFNRVGLPLIEIITLPQIHHPATAAALVRKIQILLSAVDACVLGMQSGGLRADVNVSVRRRDDDGVGAGADYAGVRGLGQRTEIKNLSSFKAVEDAIIAERDRQITVLEDGGVVLGETRGWTLGGTSTRRLRGKEGEVDYRYMPDPDLAPVIIGEDLIAHLRDHMGVSPSEELDVLTGRYGLTMKDAMTLVSLDDGARTDYYYDVVDLVDVDRGFETGDARLATMAGNWVLHELGGLLAAEDTSAGPIDVRARVPPASMASIIKLLWAKQVLGKTAKRLLALVFEGDNQRPVGAIVEERGWWFRPYTAQEYGELAARVAASYEGVVLDVVAGNKGKVKFLVGQMMRLGEDGRVAPMEAERALVALVEGVGGTGLRGN